MSTIVFAFVTFLHDPFTAIWIGGLIVIGVTILPAAMKVLGKDPQTRQLMDTVQGQTAECVGLREYCRSVDDRGYSSQIHPGLSGFV